MDFEKAQANLSENGKAMNLLLHVVIPIAIAVLGVFTKELWLFHPFAPVLLWGFLLVIYIAVWWRVNPNYEDVFSLLSKIRSRDAEIEEGKAKISFLSSIVMDLYVKNVMAFVLRAMSVEFIDQLNKSGCSEELYREIFSDILAPFYLEGDALFGFKISEKWSISVYLHKKDEKVLIPVWRETSRTHPSSDRLGRIWREGEGHVGKAFLDRRPILTGDANDESVAQLCRARGSKQHDYDDSTYVSFASVPISLSDDDEHDPYGVLVATSDVAGRLSEERTTEMLMHAAQTIALILQLSDADYGCLVNPNQHITDGSAGETGDETPKNGG